MDFSIHFLTENLNRKGYLTIGYGLGLMLLQKEKKNSLGAKLRHGIKYRVIFVIYPFMSGGNNLGLQNL